MTMGDYDRLMRELATLRDELKLQIHLGQAEARERWEHLEKRWQHLEGRAHVLADASRESLDDIGEAGQQLIDEIREGYRGLKKLL